jgi:TonB family protein
MIATRPRLFLLLASITWLALGAGAGAGAGDDVLVRARDLYRSAAYDEALALLDRAAAVPASGDEVERSEYRLFCLIALDRKSDARSAIEAMVTADPFYQLPTDQASPRVRSTFREVRQSLLPAIVQRAYAGAKSAFDRQDPQSAAQFEAVVSLLNDPDVAAVPGLADLRTVAAGFRDLSKALASRQPSAPVVATIAAPPSQVVQGENDADVVPPAVINQTLPRWIMPSGLPPGVWEGTLALVIDESGNVASVTLQKPVHPTYDAQLLRAAQSWKYRPALKNGMPTRFLKLMTVRLGTTK